MKKKICINNQNDYCKLTIGKEYEIVNETDTHYFVTNDINKIQKYEKEKFVTNEEYNLYLDKKNNPESYYIPVEVNFNLKGKIVEMEVTNMDLELRGVGDLFEFINKENPCDMKLFSEKYSPRLENDEVYLWGKKYKQDRNIVNKYFSTNSKAIDYLIKVKNVVDAFNEALKDVKIEKTKVYQIEHSPNGKLYSFISDEDFNNGDTVICDTYKGLAYGVVKGITFKPMSQCLNYSRCWSK